MPLAPNTTPAPYVPSFIQSILEGARSLKQNFAQSSLTNFENTGSFFYDPPGTGLKSTQQLNVDWSQFQNHTFFNSAEVNVNVAFDNIINTFPFDGSKKELEIFFEKLTGYEKWVYDQFPKNAGFLMFSGTVTETSPAIGTYIQVNDFAGGLYPSLSKLQTGENVLDPGLDSFTIEMQLFLADQANGIQTIVQKMAGPTNGFSLFLTASASPSTGTLVFAVVSGSSWLSASMPVLKGQFNHIAVILNRDGRFPQLQLYNNELLQGVSTVYNDLGIFGIETSPFLVGSGTAVTLGTTTWTPQQTMSGAMDELRVWHSVRNQLHLQQYARKTVFPTDDLKLYFKYNEPSGVLGPTTTDPVNSIVLDSSGHSLHALISNFSFNLRATGSIPGPMTLERVDLSPILFAQFVTVAALNTVLLFSATNYDAENPNLITRLIPEHYLIDGQAFDGQETQQGSINNQYTSQNVPGSGQLGSTQLIQTFLYVWAKFFDEMKLFVDAFSTLNYVSYDQTDTAPDQFLGFMFKQLGFRIPSLFLDASIEQYIDGDNTDYQISRGEFPLQYVENQILRRVLASMLEIVRSKGTQRSIKSFLRAAGLDPDNSFRIREFGGPTTRNLTFSRENKIEPSSLLDFSGSSVVTSPYLTSSRTEPGFPPAVGPFVTSSFYSNGYVSTNPNDGLLTSGSWTFEAIYKYPHTKLINPTTQSLARLMVTGSNTSFGGMIFNCIAVSSSVQPMVVLYGRPSSGDTLASAPILRIENDTDIFDGNKWNVSFGRIRGDEYGSNVSSSFFLRVARQEYGVIRNYDVSSSYFNALGTVGSGSQNVQQSIDSIYNVSGAFLQLGSASLPVGPTTAYRFLNQTNVVTQSEAQNTFFNGQVSQIRFWSRALSEIEWQEHVRNYKSIGVEDPLTNFNFVHSKSGSFGRLRLDASTRQPTTLTDSTGSITIFDFSQNNLHLQGGGFVTSSNPFIADLYSYSMLSPVFDEATTNEKVRVRSYQDFAKVQATPWAGVAPVYQITPSEQPTDDTRFSIEFSIIDALNRDIITIFATLDAIDNAIGDPELVWSPDYPGLAQLRDVYFNRLVDKVNIKAFFEFFRWFESSIGTFISQLIPRKTEFFGTNYVIESHMLERPKFEHLNNTIYLGEADRDALRDTILLQFVEGTVQRY